MVEEMGVVRAPGFPDGWRQRLVTLTAILFYGAATVSSARGLTIDDVLTMEGVGRVVIAADGRHVVYEWIRPYETAPNIDTLYSQDDRSALAHLYVVDLDRPHKPRQLFDQEPRAGYWIGTLSHNGRRLAVYSMIDGEVRAGVFDFDTRQIRWFEFTPNYFWFHQSPIWISSDELLYPVLPPGIQPSIVYRRGLISRIEELWRRSLEGSEPSATVLQSGSGAPDAPIAAQQGALIRANSSTGKTQLLASGYLYNFRLSPDHRRVAMLREGKPLQRGRHVDIGDAIDGISRQLVVLDLEGGATTTPCPLCNVSLGSIEWALDTRSVLFFARTESATNVPGQYFEYRVDTQELISINTGNLRIACGEFGSRPRRAIGLAGRVLVLARAESENENGRDGFVPSDCDRELRFDWFLVDAAGKHLNLTKAFKRLAVDPVGVGHEKLFVFADDSVWQLDLKGRTRRFGQQVERLRPWRRGLEAGSVSEEAQYLGVVAASDFAVLQSRAQVVLLDLQSGRQSTIEKPTADARLVAVSPSLRTAAFEYDSVAGSKIAAVRRRNDVRDVATFNSNLGGISPERSARISYEFRGHKTSSCLLLPPDWSPARKYSTVVFVYPNLGGQCAASPVQTFSPYHNPHLFTAKGYIVLFPDMSRRLVETSDGPTAEMTGSVLAAVDAGIAEGLVDKDRVLLFGTSQGHHSALQVATQTERFRAIVASFGISNFISQYGSMPLYVRLGRDSFGVGDAARFESRDSPNYLGATPWEDPMRYVRNSPLFYADRITTPVLIIHSDLDQFSLHQSEELFSALYRLGKKATYVTYWGEGHGVLSPANIRDMWKRIFSWYDEYTETSKPGGDQSGGRVTSPIVDPAQK